MKVQSFSKYDRKDCGSGGGAVVGAVYTVDQQRAIHTP